MKPLDFAMLGCGFWAQYQLAAWKELPGARCVAVCDRSIGKAQELADKLGIAHIYDSTDQLFAEQQLDFVDIVTEIDSHVALTEQAVKHRVAAICQKPLAPSLIEAQRLVDTAETAGVPLFVHENWRWQSPLRRLKEILDSGRLGRIVRARIDYANSFPVFDNQPALKELKQFILTDIGTHILDAARFLFGEASTLYCQTRRMAHDIAGEDVATVMLKMQDGMTVTCNMSYASRWEFDAFPQTMVFIEGTDGGATLGRDYVIKVFDATGEYHEQVDVPRYSWANPAYDLAHSSIVACHQNLLSSLRGDGRAETTGRDNLSTLELVFKSYESAASGSVIMLDENEATA